MSSGNLLDTLKNTLTETISEIVPKISEINPAQPIIDKTIDYVQDKLKTYMYVGIAMYALVIILLFIIIYMLYKR